MFLLLFSFAEDYPAGMKADPEKVVDAFGKNEHVKKVFWAVFVAMAGLALPRILDPVTAHQVVGVITGTGV